MKTRTRKQSYWNNSGYPQRKYKRSFEVEQMGKLFDYDIIISEYRTYKDTGDTDWKGATIVHPDYLDSFIEDLKNKRPIAQAGKNRILTLKWSREIVTISDEDMGYQKFYFTVKMDAQKLIPELDKHYQKWLNRDRQLDLFEWTNKRILEQYSSTHK